MRKFKLFNSKKQQEKQQLLQAKQNNERLLAICQENIDYLTNIQNLIHTGKVDIAVDLSCNLQHLAHIDPKISIDVIPTVIVAFNAAKAKLNNTISNIDRCLNKQ